MGVDISSIRAYCTRCQKVTEFNLKNLTLRAGDHGFCEGTGYCCEECRYTPLFPPKEVENA